MKEIRINPNPPRDPHDETAWLERDQAALRGLDLDRDPDAPADDQAASAPLPPLLATLLTTLPRPGAPWSAAQRLDWLRAAEDIFHLVYKTEGRLRIDRGE